MEGGPNYILHYSNVRTSNAPQVQGHILKHGLTKIELWTPTSSFDLDNFKARLITLQTSDDDTTVCIELRKRCPTDSDPPVWILGQNFSGHSIKFAFPTIFAELPRSHMFLSSFSSFSSFSYIYAEI